MGLLKQFFSQSPEKQEQKGDRFYNNGLWGMAKIEYEKALDAQEGPSQGQNEAETRLEEKLRQAKEALALEHKMTGQELMEGKHYDEAGELFELAIDLSRDRALISTIRQHLQKMKDLIAEDVQSVMPESLMPPQVRDNTAFPEQEEDAFMALCSTLPEKVQRSYVSYGDAFKSGYLALNRGEFDLAADDLSDAMNENPEPDSYIPLELATAYLNLGKLDEARRLLESFLQCRPEALPGYQVLCEIFWEMKAFDQAEILLESCPDELRKSLAYYLLRGETMLQAGKHSEVITFYQRFLKEYGWNEAISMSLAGAFEASGDLDEALKLYADIMNQCNSCHSPINPMIKRKFADISFDLGQRSSAILETYLALAQEDSANTPFYLERVSRLYGALGNEEEARRFKAFAELAQREKG